MHIDVISVVVLLRNLLTMLIGSVIKEWLYEN